ncbi:MAG: acetyl-CoA carboxylase carboxyltransferase subunit beta [Nitrospinae bacterium]|nr:acetyl-CoA carboxylase carboxyltransferase subunit beta [Nitrospinota bacterium]
MSWFTKVKKPLEKLAGKGEAPTKSIPAGLWRKCDSCKEIVYNSELERNFNICPKCGHHHRISGKKRVELLIDEGTFVQKDANLHSNDPLKFKDSKKYKDRLAVSFKKTGNRDSVVAGSGKINGRPVEIASMDFEFMGGSMGSVAGELITRAIERGAANKAPVIVVSCSGGARMQEGMLSLAQMAKTSAALAALAEKGVPFISVLADPTSGGVTASFAMLGDVIIAEPKALICFAGPRVIAQTIRETLPEGFQRSEFLLEHGFVDMVVHRHDMKDTLARLLDSMCAGLEKRGLYTAE